MKQQASLRLAGIAITLFASTLSFAQLAKTNTAKPEPMIQVASSIADAAGDLAVLDHLKSTNEKLYRSFTRKFAGATDITITPGKSNTVVFCKVDGIRNNILFSNKGAWIHTVRYYDIEHLPIGVKSLVQEEFPDYKLLRVAEVSTHSGTAYLVDIENKAQFKTIRVVDSEWDVYQEFMKQ